MFCALLLLAAGGMAISFLSAKVGNAQLEQGLRRPAPQLDRKDALSQQIAMFSLGGLRSLAAEIMALDATDAWMKRDWARSQQRWETVTALAPHRVNYWISASRDMATNAAGDIASDYRFNEHEQEVRWRYYIDRGEDFLLKGLANNPDSLLLNVCLGDFYSDLYRRPRFGKAVDAYRRAKGLGASSLYQRQEFYNLCRIRGREKEAWELGRDLFKDVRNRVPSVRSLLFVLQHKIEVPPEERLSVEDLYGSREKARREMETFVHNSLQFPTTGMQEFLKQNASAERKGAK